MYIGTSIDPREGEVVLRSRERDQSYLFQSKDTRS